MKKNNENNPEGPEDRNTGELIRDAPTVWEDRFIPKWLQIYGNEEKNV